MIIEEARDILQDQIDRYGQEYDAEGIEALEMAIKALGSWEKFSDKVWKRAYARGYNDAKADVLDKIIAETEKVKSVMNEEIINHDRKDLINIVNGLNLSLAIIDNYKAEREVNADDE